MKKLSTKVGSFTDKHWIQLLKDYRIEHQSQEHLLNQLIIGKKSYWCKYEWKKWVDGLKSIEDGLLCAVSADWNVMNEVLYRGNWDDITNHMNLMSVQEGEQEMLRAMKTSVEGMNLVMKLIESEDTRKMMLREYLDDDSLAARAISVVEIVLRMTAIRYDWEHKDTLFYLSHGLDEEGGEILESDE